MISEINVSGVDTVSFSFNIQFVNMYYKARFTLMEAQAAGHEQEQIMNVFR